MVGDLCAHHLRARAFGRGHGFGALGDDRGEGVISTAIAVLIVAFLGAAMYVIFTQILTSSGSKASTR